MKTLILRTFLFRQRAVTALKSLKIDNSFYKRSKFSPILFKKERNMIFFSNSFFFQILDFLNICLFSVSFSFSI